MKRLYIIFVVVLAIATGCTYTFPEAEKPSSGSTDFTKVVAVGNSLTAGYMNGALYDAGQAASYANLVAQQMAMVGSGEFNQPDINAPDGYFGMAGSTILGRLHLVNPQSPGPAPIVPGQPISAYSGGKAINNFGVPGIRVIDVGEAGYGTVNPYFGRFASDANTASVLADATAANGSFFIFWLGGNDVLGYATGGAVGEANPAGAPATNDMTPVAMFEAAFNAGISAMTANGAKGIVANVPNVHDIPHFTTVPWNAIPFDTSDPVDAGTVMALNSAYAVYNGGLDAMAGLSVITQAEADFRKIVFKNGSNGIVIMDESLTPLTGYDPGLVSMRMAKSSDLITLSAGAVLGTLADPNNPLSAIGVAVPLAEKYTLIEADLEALADRIADYNAIISATVNNSSGNLALLDVNAWFADFAQNGTTINGAGMNSSILPPFGAFSLDGVHPNARGSAYVASLFIDKINEVFGSNIPNLNPNDYPGNELPVP